VRASSQMWDAVETAMEAGKEAAMEGRKRGARRWVKAHPRPPLSIEQLMTEAYAIGYQSERKRMARVTR
jgi:hypothetical protein